MDKIISHSSAFEALFGSFGAFLAQRLDWLIGLIADYLP